MRLNYLGIWSDDDHKIVQVTYEDSDTGTIYIVPTSGTVTVVTVEGVVSTLSNGDFKKLRVGEPID